MTLSAAGIRPVAALLLRRELATVASMRHRSRWHLPGHSPNPFHPSTAIRFDLPTAAAARLSVYSPEGRLVRTLVSDTLPGGPHATRKITLMK
jgi:hypothetical protein